MRGNSVRTQTLQGQLWHTWDCCPGPPPMRADKEASMPRELLPGKAISRTPKAPGSEPPWQLVAPCPFFPQKPDSEESELTEGSLFSRLQE